MFCVNRLEFMGWVQGMLMDRDADGKVFVVDEKKCEEAQRLLDDGERIGLTGSNDEIITTMKFEEGGYRERHE